MMQRFFEAVTRSQLFQKNKTRILRLYVTLRDGTEKIFALADGTDAEGTISSIRENVQLRGANVWILICAAGLASIGLDVNSAAVIIGAMLISPLMSPILGIGLSVGINDQALLIDSLKNFGVAVGLSIGASTIYFMLTPFGEPQPELIARTSPTLLDVGVALFGGIAGIVAGSRREKTNAIPGVAIATALMPPLCTAGFGLATGRWAFFFGAFYLFFINAVFISLSTYLIVRYLHFPYHEFPDDRTRLLVKRSIMVFVVVIAVPSGVIFYNVINDLQTRNDVEAFLDQQLTNARHEPIRWELQEENDTTEYLKVYMVGDPISATEIDSHSVIMADFDLEDLRLKLIQMNIPEEERKRLTEEATMNVLNTIEISQKVQDTKQDQIDSLEATIERMRSDTIPLYNITASVRTVLPEIKTLSYASGLTTTGDSVEGIPLFVYDYSANYSRSRSDMIRSRLENYLKIRTGYDTLLLRRLAE